MKAEIMKSVSVIIGILLILSGCQKSGPIELVNEQDDSRFIEVIATGNDAESIFATSGVDTSGLVNSRFFGKMYFSQVYYSLQSRSDSFTQAEAIFLDKTKPVEWNGHMIGYASFDVGTLTLEGDTILKVQHKMRLGQVGDTTAGYQYHLRYAHSIGPGSQYNWSGSGNAGIGPFNKTGTSAPQIRVYEIDPPFVPTSAPLTLRWNCTNGYINLFISREGNQVQRAWVPVLHLRIRNVKGAIQIPAKVLEMLPMKRYQRFLFTLTSETQSVTTVSGFADDVLLHSASIHNILLNVGP
jgi:hypothetical protein